MRPRVDWLSKVDNRILEGLAESGWKATPKVIAHNIDYNRDYVNHRIRKLYDADLLDREPGERSGMYGITDLGLRYLDGKLTDDELQDLRDEG